MNESQYQEILVRLDALEQDVSDLKEAYQEIVSATPVAAFAETLTALGDRVNELSELAHTVQINGTALTISEAGLDPIE